MSRFETISSWYWSGGVAILCAALLLYAPQTAAFSSSSSASQGYTQLMESFTPQGVSTVHWTEYRTVYMRVGTLTRNVTDQLEGWYKAPDHFRHDYPNSWAVQNGNAVVWYTKSTNSYHKGTGSPSSESEYFYRPDQFGCCGFYTQDDLSKSSETTGTYKGANCSILELDYKAKTSGSADGPCKVIAGPTQILIYYDPATQRQLASEKRVWDSNGRTLASVCIRDFEYNIPLDDQLFNAAVPPGT